jgi:hypothetical protein
MEVHPCMQNELKRHLEDARINKTRSRSVRRGRCKTALRKSIATVTQLGVPHTCTPFARHQFPAVRPVIMPPEASSKQPIAISQQSGKPPSFVRCASHLRNSAPVSRSHRMLRPSCPADSSSRGSCGCADSTVTDSLWPLRRLRSDQSRVLHTRMMLSEPAASSCRHEQQRMEQAALMESKKRK